jgi:hypothetical protein
MLLRAGESLRVVISIRRPDSDRRRVKMCAGDKANIVGFFESLAPVRITRFEPHTIFDGGDKMFVLIAFEATVRGKGYSFPNNGHLWQFNAAGKVVKYDHVTDTAQMIRMANGESPLLEGVGSRKGVGSNGRLYGYGGSHEDAC